MSKALKEDKKDDKDAKSMLAIVVKILGEPDVMKLVTVPIPEIEPNQVSKSFAPPFRFDAESNRLLQLAPNRYFFSQDTKI